MIAHCFNASYSDQDLINAVQHGNYIKALSSCWNGLRMTKSSLDGACPTSTIQPSFACRGVKRHKQSELVMIEYDMCFQDNINWETARKKFQHFLHRHLEVDISSVIVEGIVSGTNTWYIMKDAGALKEALNNISKEPKIDPTKWALKASVCAAAVLIFIVAVGRYK